MDIIDTRNSSQDPTEESKIAIDTKCVIKSVTNDLAYRKQ